MPFAPVQRPPQKTYTNLRKRHCEVEHCEMTAQAQRLAAAAAPSGNEASTAW